jgi:hypothetical protein
VLSICKLYFPPFHKIKKNRPISPTPACYFPRQETISMATEKQIAANRANAEKSTGPKTIKGKATSSQNAVKTGLDAKSEVMRCESRPEYDLLIAEYYARFQPAIPEERCLVDDLIQAEWLGRRYLSSATLIWERHFYETGTDSVGKVFTDKSETLCRAQRCINQTKRNFALALKQLTALQAKRAADPDQYTYEPPPAPEPPQPETVGPAPNEPPATSNESAESGSFLTPAAAPPATSTDSRITSQLPEEIPEEILPIA